MFQWQVEDKQKFQELVELVRHNEAPADAPVPPDPSTAVKDAGVCWCVSWSESWQVLSAHLFVCPRSSCKWFSTNQAQIYSYLKSVRRWSTVIFICNLYNAMLVLFGRLLFLGLFFLFYFKTVSYNLGIAFSLWITVFVEAFPNVFANCSCIVNISICSLIHWCQVQCLIYLSAIQYWAFSDNLLSSGTELLRI